jgi:hypothetical protein
MAPFLKKIGGKNKKNCGKSQKLPNIFKNGPKIGKNL